MTSIGVYEIVQKSTGKRYVGSSLNLERREYMHFWTLEKGTHFNRHLQRAFTKHGFEDFIWNLLELCVAEVRYVVEQKHVDLGCGFNIVLEVEKPGKMKWGTARKAAVSKRMMGNKHLLGHVPTKETRKKLSTAGMGRSPSKLARQKAKERMIDRNQNNPPRKGKVNSAIHRERISQVMSNKGAG